MSNSERFGLEDTLNNLNRYESLVNTYRNFSDEQVEHYISFAVSKGESEEELRSFFNKIRA